MEIDYNSILVSLLELLLLPHIRFCIISVAILSIFTLHHWLLHRPIEQVLCNLGSSIDTSFFPQLPQRWLKLVNRLITHSEQYALALENHCRRSTKAYQRLKQRNADLEAASESIQSRLQADLSQANREARLERYRSKKLLNYSRKKRQNMCSLIRENRVLSSRIEVLNGFVNRLCEELARDKVENK
ncbi:hypothetical protein MJO29_017059 [Puccinia striiformis f. sp. tritici]|nr:hypothetical protein MJO29_017059 [Puccinia striiformis f. sp. tritici]